MYVFVFIGLILNNLKFEMQDKTKRLRDQSAPLGDNNAGGGSSNRRGGDDDEDGRDGKPITLQSCIEAFTEAETLGENDAWYCSECKDFKCATKKLDLYNSPDLLIIHLKRFSYTRLNRDRINTLVKFPIEKLDIREHVIDNEARKDAIYNLFAVSNHMGGMGGGHYTAYAKNLRNGRWYHLDDSRASLLNDTSQIVSSAAYVLYYARTAPRNSKQRASRVRIPNIDDDDNDNNTNTNDNNSNTNNHNGND